VQRRWSFCLAEALERLCARTGRAPLSIATALRPITHTASASACASCDPCTPAQTNAFVEKRRAYIREVC